LTDRLQAFEKGVDDCLAKPFFIEELIIRIKTMVSRKQGGVGLGTHNWFERDGVRSVHKFFVKVLSVTLLTTP
jgi:DNA-binding response OmpR family regulator